MSNPDKDTFKCAQDHIFTLMYHDCFPRFIKSKHYKQLLKKHWPRLVRSVDFWTKTATNQLFSSSMGKRSHWNVLHKMRITIEQCEVNLQYKWSWISPSYTLAEFHLISMHTNIYWVSIYDSNYDSVLINSWKIHWQNLTQEQDEE